MDKKMKDSKREQYVKALMDFMSQTEDVGLVTSGSFNFPIVADDGSEGWVEIVVKIPNDEGDDGYDKRSSYALHLKEQAQKKAEANAKKKAKIEADKTKRAEKERLKAEAEKGE